MLSLPVERGLVSKTLRTNQYQKPDRPPAYQSLHRIPIMEQATEQPQSLYLLVPTANDNLQSNRYSSFPRPGYGYPLYCHMVIASFFFWFPDRRLVPDAETVCCQAHLGCLNWFDGYSWHSRESVAIGLGAYIPPTVFGLPVYSSSTRYNF